MACTTSAGRLLAGRYRIERPLGTGGMGTVWAARDERLHREVAVKEVVPPATLTAHEREVLEERTLREARAAARIASPHAVTVFDVLDEDERPWIVMERLSGRTLADVLRERGPLDAPVVARLGLQLLDALTAAHRADVLHRDVKPSNVLVDEDGNAVLSDFGIATLDGDPGLTTTGTLIGSPAFIAPERARGGPATPATDLFSLGATLYAAAEGHPPFERGGQLPTLTAVVTEEVPPPRVGGPLGEALRGLLDKDPGQRLSADQARTLLQAAARAGTPTAVLTPVAAPPAEPAPPAYRDPLPDDARTQRLEVPPAARPEEGRTAAGAAPGAAAAPVAAAESEADVRTPAAGADDVDRGTHAPAAADQRPPTEPTPGRPSGRRTGLLAALAAVVLLVVGAGVALHGHDGGTSAGAPADPAASAAPSSGASSSSTSSPRATPTTSASAAPAPTTTSPQAPPPSSAKASAAGVPAGYALRSGPGGFQVAVPAGWTTSTSGQVVKYRDPQSGQMLLVDQTDTPKADPAADWRTQEQARRSTYPGYSRIRIEPVDYRGWKAADWEFTYDGPSGLLHVLNRGFVTSPHQAYSLFVLAPQSQWSQAKQAFDVAAASFRPGG